MSKPKEKPLFSNVVSIPQAGRDSLEEAINQFQLWEMRSRDCIEVKRCYIDVAKDLEAGVLLSQIIYWHLPNSSGEQKLSVYRDGHWWLAKGRSDWWAECRLTPKQFDRAIRHLEEQQLVCAHVYKWQGQNTKHIRIDWAGLLQALSLLDAKADSVIGFRRREPVSSSLRKRDQISSKKISEQISSELPNRESKDSLLVNSQIPYQSSSELPNRESKDSLLVNSQIPYQSSSELPNRELHLYTEITSEITTQINLPPIPPQGGKKSVGKENLTPQPERPGTGIESPSLATLSNQPDSQLKPFTPHEEQCAAASLVGNKAMKVKQLVKNELEKTTLQECQQNVEPAISQRDEEIRARADREFSAGDEYAGSAAIQTKIAATQPNPPAVLSHQPEQSFIEPNIFGRDENSAVLPLTMGAAIETSPTTSNPSQHQAPGRQQTDSRFHPRYVAKRDQENRFDHNQSDFPKNLDGSDLLPWDTNKRGAFDQQFENHMARSLMQYPAYRDLMAGELITKVRKHISAGKYDLKRRDELLIEWSAMHDHTRNDFSTASSTLTAKGAARRAKIARALNMKDFS